MTFFTRIYFLFVFLFVLHTFEVSYAQAYFGMASSNYAGVQSLQYNPANVADTRFWLDINLSSLNLTFTNNVLTTNGSFLKMIGQNQLDNFAKLSQYFNVDVATTNYGDFTRIKKELFSKIDYHVAHPDIFAGLQILGPSIMIDLGNRYGFALTTKYTMLYNVIDQMDNGDALEGIDNYLSKDTLTPSEISHLYNVGNFKSVKSQFAEIGFTFGGVVLSKGADFLKVGVTLKRYVGIDLSITKTLRMSTQITKVTETPSLTMAGEYLSYNYYNPYLTKQNVQDQTAERFNYFVNGFLGLDTKIPSGWGMDFGVVYEYRPDIEKYKFENAGHNYTKQYWQSNVDYTQNKYLFKISAAFTDIGYIDFSKDKINLLGLRLSSSEPVSFPFQNASNMLIGRINELVPFVSQETRLFNSAAKVLDTNYNNKTLDYRVPTTFVFGVDYQIRPHWFIAFQWRQNLLVKYANGARNHTLLNITPRYESPLIDVGLPISYNTFVNQLYWGLGMRVGMLHWGFDNIMGLFGDFQSMNFYAGLRLFLRKKDHFKRYFDNPDRTQPIRYGKDFFNEKQPLTLPSQDDPNKAPLFFNEANTPTLPNPYLRNKEKKISDRFLKDINTYSEPQVAPEEPNLHLEDKESMNGVQKASTIKSKVRATQQKEIKPPPTKSSTLPKKNKINVSGTKR